MERSYKGNSLELLTSNLNFRMLVDEPVFRFLFTRDLIVDEEPARINGYPLPLGNITAKISSLEVWVEEKGKALIQGLVEGESLFFSSNGIQEINWELEEFLREVELPGVIPGMELNGHARVIFLEESSSPLEAEGKIMYQLRVEIEIFISVVDHQQMNIVVGVKDVSPDKISREVLIYEELLKEKAIAFELSDSLKFSNQPSYVRMLGHYLKDFSWEWAKEGINVKGEAQTSYYYYSDEEGEGGFRENRQFFQEHVPLSDLKKEAVIMVYPCIEAVYFDMSEDTLEETINVHLFIRATREMQQEVLRDIQDVDIKKDYVTLYRTSATNEEPLELLEKFDLQFPRNIFVDSTRLSELSLEVEESKVMVDGILEKTVCYLPSGEDESLSELQEENVGHLPRSFTVEEDFSRSLNLPGVNQGYNAFAYVSIRDTEFSPSNSIILQITHGKLIVKVRQKQEYTVVVPSRVPKGTSLVIYTVQPGDTLLKIARVYGINTALLAEANTIKEEYEPQIGEKLLIPLFLSS